MSDTDPRLARLIDTPNLRRWMNETDLKPGGAQAILDYARDQVQWAQGEGAHPIVAMQAAIASYCAMCEGAGFPRKEQLDFLVMHFKLIAPVVIEHVAGWNADLAADAPSKLILN